MRFHLCSSGYSYWQRRFISRCSLLSFLPVIAAAFLICVTCCGIARGATPSFAAEQNFDSGVNPRAVAVGDLNDDGKADLATANLSSNTVSVLLNTTLPGAATSTFADKKDFATGTEPVSVTLGDVNGDGKLDLAVVNFAANNISILINTTAPGALTPTFAGKQDFATAEGPLFAAVGDLNSDGKLDFAVVDVLSNSVSVLLNTTAPGAATVNFAVHQEFATELGPTVVQMGDLNGDGKLDLAVANFNAGTISILVNTTGAGAINSSFGELQEFAVDDEGLAFISLGDLNRDGTLDFVAANAESATVSVLLNTTAPGATTVSLSANQQFDAGLVPLSITIGDLDGDGRLDLAIANRNSNNVSVLLNTMAPGDTTSSFAPKQDFATGNAPSFLQAADLNNDGKVDLSVANLNSSSVSVLLNTTDQGTATPSFSAKQDVAAGLNPRSVAVGDLNGDGRTDLAVANVNSNSVSVLLSNTLPGATITTFTARLDFATGDSPVSLTVGDLNMDGKLDLAVANINSSTVSVYLNRTLPGAATPDFVKQDFTTGDAPLFVAVGDLNGDGKPDLVLANLVATVSVLFNTTVPGAGTPTFAPKLDLATGDGPRSISLADINRDGKLDLAVVNFNSDSIAVLLNTTDTGAATPSFGAIHEFSTGFRPVSITSGDLNKDGNPDLAVVNLNSNNVSVLLNTTAPGADVPSFAARKDFDTGFNPRSMIVGDFNGDGRLDLAVAKSGANNVSLLVNATPPGNAEPEFASKQDFAAGANSLFVASGDLNSDGKPDLVTANFDANTASVLLNTPAIVTATGLSVPQGSAAVNLQIATVANYAGNGNVIVKAISDDLSNGITISNVRNSDGNVTADIAATCGATAASFTLRASDGISTVIGPLSVTVTDNTPPTLSYQDQTVALDGSFDINPTTLLDNGGVPAFTLQSAGTFTGRIRVDGAGVVSVFNAAPAGTHDIVIRATDDCGLTTDAHLKLTVGKADQTIIFNALENKVLGDPDFAVDATASSGLAVSFAAIDQCTVTGNTVHITGAGSCTITASQAGDSNFNPAPDVVQTFTTVNDNLITLSQANYNVNESAGFVTITVNRTGDLSQPVNVAYATDDSGSSNVCSTLNSGLASTRCDFGLTLGTLTFAAAESQKTFIIPITQDSYAEGPETFRVNLFKLSGGASFGVPSSATVTIMDGTIQLPPNAIDDSETFVRQQYRDFLNREADPAGLAFWTAEIDNCTPKPQCTVIKRTNTSAAFFLSIEFQTTGNLVRNFYVVALDRPETNNMPSFEEFARDTQAMQRGVIVDPNNNAWETVLANNRRAFTRDFVTRAEFIGMYPTTDTPEQYVDKLFRHAGITPEADERSAVIAEFGNATTAADTAARGQALLDIVQSTTVQQREFNRSFVQMQYFGYLRRNPNDAPDGNFDGFNFWLSKLNQFNGNFQDAEMVQAFLFSDEYRHRFGR